MYALWFNIGLLTGASASGAAPVTPPASATGWSRKIFKQKRQEAKTADETAKPAKRDVIVLGKGAKEIITGLVAKEKDRLRKMQLADDEWLMLN
jgi:hypothetical protein